MKIRIWMVIVLPMMLSISAFGPTVYHVGKSLVKLKDGPKRLEQVLLPGDATISVKKSGKQKIFYEYVSKFKGSNYITPKSRPNMIITVRDPNGKELDLHDRGYSETYSGLHDRSGYYIESFDAPVKGTYFIHGELNDPNSKDARVFAIGPGLFSIHIPHSAVRFRNQMLFGALALFLVLGALWYTARTKPDYTPRIP